MKRRSAPRKKRTPRNRHQIDWLPFDSRLLPDIISFSHVRGIAKVFLVIEMSLSVFIVSCSIGMALVKLFF